MAKFTLGLSMAGTVSVGSYTAGSLTQINTWLHQLYFKKRSGGKVVLPAVAETTRYKPGELVTIEHHEIPDHDIEIASLTGASGGGINAALYTMGLALGNVETILRDTWLPVDVREMLDIADIDDAREWFSLLNSGPIDAMLEQLKNTPFGPSNFTKDLGYLADVLEIYQTLSSYEGIPYSLKPAMGADVKVQYGTYFTHTDYTRFGFAPKAENNSSVGQGNQPFRPGLSWQSGVNLGQDPNWLRLINSSAATSAFPIGFKPRSLKRFRNEYDGKLFYLDYNNRLNNSSNAPFSYLNISPIWNPGPTDEGFDMEYFDGGAFNRDTHDLARASLLRKLGLSQLPNTGEDACAAVVLIDPFPNDLPDYDPGQKVKGLPNLLKQIPLLIGSLMDQGRFRADWIEKTADEKYYSRYLISAVRKDSSGKSEKYPLAGDGLGAFSGFLDRAFREHDYHLGIYNTHRFLSEYFVVPVDNKTVTYCNKDTPVDLLEKYEAVGWYKPKLEGGAHCQVIPRCVANMGLNSQQPDWPIMSAGRWSQLKDMAESRAKIMADNLTNLGLFDRPLDWVIWKLFGQKRFAALLQEVEDELKQRQQLS